MQMNLAGYPLILRPAEIINIHHKDVEINQDYSQLYVLYRGFDQEKEWRIVKYEGTWVSAVQHINILQTKINLIIFKVAARTAQ